LRLVKRPQAEYYLPNAPSIKEFGVGSLFAETLIRNCEMLMWRQPPFDKLGAGYGLAGVAPLGGFLLEAGKRTILRFVLAKPICPRMAVPPLTVLPQTPVSAFRPESRA
jgi:hypothetical protein